MSDSQLQISEMKASLFKQLAHPVRIRALEQLLDGERSVGDLAELLGVDISHLSQQLAILRRSEIVATRREGNSIYYRIADAQFGELIVLAKKILLQRLYSSQQIIGDLEADTAAGRRHR